MSCPEALHGTFKDWAKLALGVASGGLGLAGTWLMSRRYAKRFFRGVFYAVIAPILWAVHLGQGLRSVLEEDAKDNSDLPDSPTDMTLGLILLFWSFFLQLVLPWFDAKF